METKSAETTPTSSAATTVDKKDDSIVENDDSKPTGENSNNLSLVEAARKYEELRGAQKRKYDEVETVTGEEDEINIIEINCKLFTFLDQNWEERGRGSLRLNDSKSSQNKQSRVVFRASGSLRVLLNTQVRKFSRIQRELLIKIVHFRCGREWFAISPAKSPSG